MRDTNRLMRREWLQWLQSTGIATAGTLALAAQTTEVPRTEPPRKRSPFTAAQRFQIASMKNLYNSLLNGQATANQLVLFKESTKLALVEIGESGVLMDIETWMRANQTLILGGLDQDTLDRVQALAKTHLGRPLDPGLVSQWRTPTADPTAYNRILELGIGETFNRALGRAEADWILKLQPIQSNNWGNGSAQNQSCAQWNSVVNTIAVVGAFWGLGGLVGCVPCVIGAILFAVGAGVLRYFTAGGC